MSEQPYRLETGGRIERGQALRFAFDGRALTGHPGDTLASALLANGVRIAGRSVDLGRPRGVYTAGVEEPNALVHATHDPMVPATTLELHEGLTASSLRGRGKLDLDAPGGEGRYDKAYAHCDVLVIGAGPAGLAAALAAGSVGARVVLVDERPELGGDLLDSRVMLDGHPATRWVAATKRRLAALPDVRVLRRTTAIGYYDHNYIVAAERRGPESGRLWHLRARRVILAAGAHERSVAFPGNDRPGVMLASAARTYVNRYGVLPGRRAIVFTCADSGYDAANDLLEAGAEIVAVVDPRPASVFDGVTRPGDFRPGSPAAVLMERGVPILRDRMVTGTSADADGVLTAVHVGGEALEGDLLAVCGGWNPAVQLFSQSQGRLRFDSGLQANVPHLSTQAERSVGACRGLFGTSDVIEDGYAAGSQAAELAGIRERESFRVPVSSDGTIGEPPAPLWVVPSDSFDEAFVDLQRDVTVADIARALGTGMRSAEHVKRYTTAGTGADQGKTSLASGVMSALLGSDTGPTTFRPPYTPVSFALLAGRDRGVLSDPVRVTALHDRHVARGAAFEDVGQWKRPRYFPRLGESMDEAVLRESHAVRTDCGAIDASTLGKIDIRGQDAGEFLDRVYTNLYSTLPVGSCRYGVMCTADGMVFDDGVTARLGEDHYLMTTTTGNAAAVLDWLEEWRQTEWPSLKVWFTSVTDHWATVAVVGPRSRAVVAALAPDLDLDDFPFMKVRPARVLGVDARVFRISFSGELAYEINVPAWYGAAVWDAVLSLDVVPYGTETMHVLRAEKGFMMVGHETDGTVTPQDLGMSWIVAKKGPDFIGKRSYARPDTARDDRKRLVGLLPDDPGELLAEGAQLIAGERHTGIDGREPMLGHVTSSYRSAALGRTFALAVARAAVGDRVLAWSGGRAVPVTAVEPIFYDPANARRDGDPSLTVRSPHLPDRRKSGRELAVRPLAAFAGRFAASATSEVSLRELPFPAMIEVRGAVVPSPEPERVLELGPDWWLIVEGEAPGVPAGSAVDVSAQRAVLELSGPGVRDVLMTGCPIDLHPSVFEVGRHTQTLLARAQIILQRTDPDTYRIFVRSSFASYLAEWLLDAINS